MSARARWRPASEVAASDVDLLDSAIANEAGVPFDLREKDPLREVTEMMAEFDRLADRGVTCSIREQVDTCCLACPISMHGDQLDPMGDLCRMGQKWDTVLTEQAVVEHLRTNAPASQHV